MMRLILLLIPVLTVLVIGLLGGARPQSVDAKLPASAPGQSAGISYSPGSTPSRPNPLATPTLIAVGGVCAGLIGRVPNAALNEALCAPRRFDLCNNNVPPSWWNVQRAWLQLIDAGKPYHPQFNGLVWKCGCR